MKRLQESRRGEISPYGLTRGVGLPPHSYSTSNHTRRGPSSVAAPQLFRPPFHCKRRRSLFVNSRLLAFIRGYHLSCLLDFSVIEACCSISTFSMRCGFAKKSRVIR